MSAAITMPMEWLALAALLVVVAVGNPWWALFQLADVDPGPESVMTITTDDHTDETS
jgi:hypothetical protein